MKRLLLGISVILTSILALQWRDWPAELPDSASQASLAEGAEIPSPPVSAEGAPMPRPQDDYVAVIERPLFLPERRPPEDEVAEQPVDDLSQEITDLTKLDVTATLILSPSNASVWVRNSDQPELVRLRLGEDYRGWTVAGIEHDRVVMERQGATETLELLDFSKPSPAIGRQQRQINQRPGARSLPRPISEGSPSRSSGRD